MIKIKKCLSLICVAFLIAFTFSSCGKLKLNLNSTPQTAGETSSTEQATQYLQTTPTDSTTTSAPSTVPSSASPTATPSTAPPQTTVESISPPVVQDELMPSSTTVKYELYSNIQYGNDEKQVMDIYVPFSAYERKFNGVILFIHGGSWTGGDKSEMESRSIDYAEKGYITANMNYRLYTEGGNVNGISMISDVNDAIKKLKRIFDDKSLNVSKLATSGYSAGAHISMLYTYANTNSARGKELNIIKPAIPIVFTANQVGPADFRAGVWGSGNGDTGLNLAQLLSGYTLTKVENEEVVLVADEKTVEYALNLVSPATHVTSSAVPSLFGYAGNDYIVPPGNRESIINACKNADIRHDLVMYPRSGHMLLFDPKSDLQYKALFDEYCLTYFGY